MKILIITDCHHLLPEEAEKLADLEYDVCFFLGDISGKYIDMLLMYLDKDKVYGKMCIRDSVKLVLKFLHLYELGSNN